MATAEQPRYMWIPPPPLPEFCLPKDKLDKKKKSASSWSSGTDPEDNSVVDGQVESVKVTVEKKRTKNSSQRQQQPAVVGDGTYDGLPPPPYCFVGLPPPAAQTTAGNDVPPLAIYHICRICLQPRSGRYHREHPIPIDGVPPPPGICRRCRVTSVKESSEIDISEVDEVVRKGRSNDIKIGCITPFISEDAIISNQEAKRMQAQRYLRGRSGERHITIFREASSESQYRRPRSKSRRDDIVYRHVRVVEEAPATRKAAASHNATRKDSNESQRHVRYERDTEQAVETYREPKVSRSAMAKGVKSTNLAKIDSTRAWRSSQVWSMTSGSTTREASTNRTPTVTLKRPERTDAEIRKIAGEEAQRHAGGLQKPERSESVIRRIAHEEVARYREAERKLEARPGAFSHGKMVTVQRQVEDQKDQISAMPRKDPSKTGSRKEVAGVENPPVSERSKSISSLSYRSSQSRTRSEQESWGPQWRRELSLERRRANETRDERCGIEVVEESRSSVSVPPSDLLRSDKPRSTYDVVRDPTAPLRTSTSQQQAFSDIRWKPSEPEGTISAVEGADMGLLFSPARRHQQRDDIDRERETVERLSVRKQASPAQHRGSTPAAASKKSKRSQDRSEATIVRSTTARSSARRDTLEGGDTRHDDVRSSVKAWERKSEEHAAFLVEKEQSQKADLPSQAIDKTRTRSRQESDVQYEYKLHTVRPASRPEEERAETEGSLQRAGGGPGHVTLEIWQQVPTDPVQREREASMHEKERDAAVEWLKKRMDDPTAQVGVDSDGSRRFACSIPYSGSEMSKPRSPPRLRRPSSRQSPPPRNERSPRRQQKSGPQRSGGHRGGGGDAEQWSDRERVVEVWEQVPEKEAARYRRDNAGAAPKEYVIEAWKQVPSDRPSASNVRRDSAMAMAPARRRRERRAHLNKASDDSTHVKFASKVDISPTPPGSDESSNAYWRFHDFGGRKATRQQIDGHDSEEKGEDLIAEYERRGRLRSRDAARQKSDYGSSSRSAKDRDETVRPQRRYDGKRDEEWRPLQRALSESPSRERDDKKRLSTKAGPPYHPDEKPTGSMTTHDGSRTGSRRW